MIQYERREMPAGRPARDYDRALNTVLGTLRVEPVKRGSQLIRDLSETRVRGERVAGQGGRPATCQRTFGEEGKYFLAVALPITTVNVNEARCLRIGGRIEVPLRPLSWSIRQIEVLRTLLAESFRTCDPAFGFFPREVGPTCAPLL